MFKLTSLNVVGVSGNSSFDDPVPKLLMEITYHACVVYYYVNIIYNIQLSTCTTHGIAGGVVKYSYREHESGVRLDGSVSSGCILIARLTMITRSR